MPHLIIWSVSRSTRRSGFPSRRKALDRPTNQELSTVMNIPNQSPGAFRYRLSRLSVVAGGGLFPQGLGCLLGNLQRWNERYLYTRRCRLRGGPVCRE